MLKIRNKWNLRIKMLKKIQILLCQRLVTTPLEASCGSMVKLKTKFNLEYILKVKKKNFRRGI